MNLPIPVELACAVLREILRVFGLPWHIIVHRFQRDAWRAKVRRAIEHGDASPEPRGLDEFARRCDPARAGHVFVSAGEASGEAHATNLVRACDPGIRFTAFGGKQLEGAGARVVYPLSEHAVMGVGGVLKSLPFVIGAHKRFLEMLRDDPPSLVVLVDYPGLHLVMARAAKNRGIPVLHYIAPQYWGWMPWRVHRYRKAVDATLTILPFEETFYADAGFAAAYVGHPLLDQLSLDDPPERDDLLCIMPGSRRKELELHLAPMVRAARKLREANPGMRVVLPHRDPRREPLIRELLAETGADFVEFELGDTEPWLRRARAVLVKSGTGSLEAALCGAPTVVVYVLASALLRWLQRSMLNVPFVAGANLIAGRAVMPEFVIHEDTDWARAEAALEAVWRDGSDRDRCLQGIRDVRARLGDPGASHRAARWVNPFGPRSEDSNR